MANLIIYVQEYPTRFVATGDFGKVSNKAGADEAASAYVKKWYGDKYQASRVKSLDASSRGNTRGSELSIHKMAYRIVRRGQTSIDFPEEDAQ